MQLLRQFSFNRYGFGLVKKLASLKGLKSCLPIRNGGLKTINREVLAKYCNKKISQGHQSFQTNQPLIRSVQDLKQAIYEDPVLRMCFQGALDSIPTGGFLHSTPSDVVFQTISQIAITPPAFEAEDITGVPFYALFIDFLDTRFGQAFFTNPVVNQHLRNIFNDYQTMLSSQLSLKWMNTETGGWFSAEALKFWEPKEYYIDYNDKHWGFKNWNDWFSRRIRPEARPFPVNPKHKGAITNSSDSYPLQYDDASNGSNPAYNVQGYDNFWLKDNRYSLYDMLGAEKMGIKTLVDNHFVGGTVYQAFLDPWCYHRWHAPVSGTIVKSFKLGGTYYLDNPSLELGNANHQIENYIDSQPLLSVVSVRQVFIIRMDNGKHVAVIEIGMAEVSSCQPTVIQGQRVNQGDQLGYFQFGGSSHAIIFDKNFKDLQFNPSIKDKLQDGKPVKQLVNSWLCTYNPL